MLERVWRFFASVRLTIVLLVVLAAAMAVGTYIETTHSNGAARILVYKTWWFDGLLLLVALNLIGCTLRRAPYRPHQAGWITTHIALLIIMSGAVISHRFGVQGQMMVAEGETSHTFYLEQLDRATLETVYRDTRELPFQLHCRSFDQVFYPGSGMTRMFRSQVNAWMTGQRDTLRYDIVLNHPLVYDGYKISQASFTTLDDGKQATVLGVAYDPGVNVLYVGGGLLVLGMAGIFFVKPYLKRKFPPPPKSASVVKGNAV
jgi:cytochrome c biogenesis protein ResB